MRAPLCMSSIVAAHPPPSFSGDPRQTVVAPVSGGIQGGMMYQSKPSSVL